jgi:hypothetical protein
MARAVISSRQQRRPAYEPLYQIDPRTGGTLEVFYGDPVLARSFGASGPGWFYWSCRQGRLPDQPPSGPFTSSYLAYRRAVGEAVRVFGRCANLSTAAQNRKP